jgi:hypothetical protein
MLSLALLLPATAGAGEALPRLTITGDPGERGEIVAMHIGLSGDAAGAAVTADLDIAFPADLLRFLLPVRDHCVLAPRLTETHQVGGMQAEDGVLTLAIFSRDLEIAPLGDGPLVSCEVEILPAADRSPAPLTPAFASLGNATGQLLDVEAVAGAVIITDLPGACLADCDGNGEVTVDEAIRAVSIALGNQPLSACPVADGNGDGQVTINELIESVKDVIGGC